MNKKSSKIGKRWQKLWKIVVGLGIVIGIISGILAIAGVNLKSLFNSSDRKNPLQLTIYVHGPKGRQDIVLENRGRLLVDFGNRRDNQLIGQDGRTNFGEIEPRFLNQEIEIDLKKPVEYEKAFPDSVYVYTGAPIYFEVKIKQRYGRIEGVVWDNENRKIANVLVTIDRKFSLKTDSSGHFLFQVPQDSIKKKYTISFSKEGYETESQQYFGGVSPIDVILAKTE